MSSFFLSDWSTRSPKAIEWSKTSQIASFLSRKQTPSMPVTAAAREPDVGLGRGFSASGTLRVCGRLRNK